RRTATVTCLCAYTLMSPTLSNTAHFGGSATGNAWGQWNLHHVCSHLNFQRRLKRLGSKLDENDGTPVLARLNAQDMGLIGCAHERAHGVSKLGAQLCGQERSESLLRYRVRALFFAEGLIWHTLLLKGCSYITGRHRSIPLSICSFLQHAKFMPA